MLLVSSVSAILHPNAKQQYSGDHHFQQSRHGTVSSAIPLAGLQQIYSAMDPLTAMQIQNQDDTVSTSASAQTAQLMQ